LNESSKVKMKNHNRSKTEKNKTRKATKTRKTRKKHLMSKSTSRIKNRSQKIIEPNISSKKTRIIRID
jgi:hypothetical protein